MHEFDSLITLLLDEEDYIVEDTVEEYDDMVEREPQTVNGRTEKVKIIGNLIGLLENLDNEASCMIAYIVRCSFIEVYKDPSTYRRA